MAVDSFSSLVIPSSAILAASRRALRSCWVKWVGTATTAVLLSKLFFSRVIFSLLR